MTRFALRGLLGRKLRTVLTALAIVLGVAMISGTYVLTDSIDRAFDAIFARARTPSSPASPRSISRRGADPRIPRSTSRSSTTSAGFRESLLPRAAWTARRRS
jgi:hypothetical protein